MNSIYEGKKVAILGFGLEGRDAFNFLKGSRAKITIFDKKVRKKLNLSGVNISGVNLITGENYLHKGLGGFEVIIRSPGVYRFLPEIVDAERQGTVVTSAIKLFFEYCPAKIIGVTGTKGKGTTSTLIYKTLKLSKQNVHLAGNIGKPYLTILPSLTGESWVVLELSSFQLIDMEISPHIAVVLGITSDHMDWHKDLNEYRKAKQNIVKHQGKKDYAVINYDYETSRKYSAMTKSKKYYFSKLSNVNGSYVEKEIIYLSVDKRTKIIEASKLLLKGKHNWENITAAICTSYLAGVDIRDIRKTVSKFEGLEHRLEFAGRIKDISFYNDSFATGPQPTIAAINSFEKPITLILGGYDKGLEYQDLTQHITEKENIKTVVLIGNLAKKMLTLLNKQNYQGKIINMGKPSMIEIVKIAYKNTLSNGIVLFSPSAASFDMFDNYKDRGNQFKDCVNKLKS